MEYKQVVTDPQWRQRGDDIAATVFVQLKHAIKQADSPISLLDFGKIQQQPTEVQQLIATYFDTCGDLPNWADLVVMNRGAELFSRYGPQIVVSLFCNALPACYCCANGASVLVYTGRMVREGDCRIDAQRYTNRVMETAQFIMNVMAPNAMETKEGIESILKIRLIHAAIRHYLTPEFPVAKQGLPINQQDMLGTLMSFSYLSLDTLEKLGVRLSTEQKNDFIHLWNVIGAVLGIDEALLPRDVEAAAEATQAILVNESAVSQEGVDLTASLTLFIDEVLWRNMFADFSAFMIRYLLGDTRADMLGVKPHNPVVRFAAVPCMRFVMRSYEVIVRNNPMLKRWVGGASVQFLQALIHYYANDKQIEFRVPRYYKDRWHLS